MDTRKIRKEIEDIPINHPEVIKYIRRAMEEGLQETGILTDFIYVPGETRTNVVITEPDGRHIKVNQPGAAVSENDCAAFLQRVASLAQPGDYWIITGSLPPGAPVDWYVKLTEMAHSVGAEVWANRTGCNKAARSTTVPYQIDPFDGTISAAEYFTTLFDPAYDKIGVAKYSTNTTNAQSLTSSLSGVKTTIHNFVPPSGSTNIAGGLAAGRLILDGAGKRANAVRVLVLLTDGIANYVCGSDSAYSTGDYNSVPCGSTYSSSGSAESHAYSEAVRATNAQIMIFTIGLGNGVNAAFLERIADGGTAGVGPCQENEDGCRYYFAPTPAQLDEAFEAIAEQTHIALVK